MTYQRYRRHQWQIKSWLYKRCSKCFYKTKYEDILDLYVIKDSSATWICSHCHNSETILLNELFLTRSKQPEKSERPQK